MSRSLPLAALQFGLLSLGDRHYRNFCGFGRDLDAWLRRQGAQALFTPIEVDNGNLRSLQDWQQQLGMLTTGTVLPAWQAARYGRWRLAERRLLNPGSRGGPTYHIALEALDPRIVTWEAGDVAEVLPHNSERQVAEILTALKQDGNTTVQVGGRSQTLASVLARSLLPTALNGDSAQHLASSLEILPYRAYSISSLPQDGCVHLLVRQARREDGKTEYAPVGAEIELRIRANPNFRLPDDDRPLILIGNGTGLAGLRSHLKGRALAGHLRNWLIFGERNADCDFYYREEIEDWQARDVLERVDLAFSRDQSTRVYVQHRLQAAAETVRAWLATGAALYVCGSIVGMAPGVEAALTHIIGPEALERLAAEGRYRRDVY
jgi:sulfite reductase (NADPH) flavoprotein alpha-component